MSVGSSLTVRNSTISGNSTDGEGGGIFQSAGPDATFTMVNSTVTGNDTSSDNAGGGIQFFGAATIVYSTIVNNTATNEANLSGYTGDPSLAALASNGGPTETREPLSGSPLVDAIPTGSCQNDGAAGITTDQRFLPRPAADGCDIGAVEVQPTPPGPGPSPVPGSERGTPGAPGAAVTVVAVARFTG